MKTEKTHYQQDIEMIDMKVEKTNYQQDIECRNDELLHELSKHIRLLASQDGREIDYY